jgi:uncharacterized membrane protein YvbJ
MLITRSNIKTLKPISTMDYDPSEEFSKSSVNGQHLFRNKEMKNKEIIKWAFITYTVIFIILGIIGTLTYYLP